MCEACLPLFTGLIVVRPSAGRSATTAVTALSAMSALTTLPAATATSTTTATLTRMISGCRSELLRHRLLRHFLTQ